MKKDVVVAIVIVLVVFAAMFAVAQVRVPLPPTSSHPVAAERTSRVIPGVSGPVIMRVNGEPITQNEFDAAYAALPPEMQQQFASPQGKLALAEELVKMKLLDQEALQKGLDKDQKVAGQIAFESNQLLANAAVQQLVPKANEADVKKFYEQNKSQLQTIDLYGIVVAFQGSAIPPRNGGPAPTQDEAMRRGAQIAQALQKGADLAQLAKQFSDDTASASRGGFVGSVAPGSLPEELDQAVQQMRTGEIAGPIPSRIGVWVFKAGQRKVQPLEGELKQRIEQMVRQKETVTKLDAMRKMAKVDFDPKFFPQQKTPTPPPPPGRR